MGSTSEQILGKYMRDYITLHKVEIIQKMQHLLDEEIKKIQDQRKNIQDERIPLKSQLEGHSEEEITESETLTTIRSKYRQFDRLLQNSHEEERSLIQHYKKKQAFLEKYV